MTKASDYATANGLTYDAPFEGNYRIQIPVYNSNLAAQGITEVVTEDIAYADWETSIKRAIFAAAPE